MSDPKRSFAFYPKSKRLSISQFPFRYSDLQQSWKSVATLSVTSTQEEEEELAYISDVSSCLSPQLPLLFDPEISMCTDGDPVLAALF